ncbi:hypothetical protein EJB05_26140, partial [Eragrostis curvula]
MRQVQLDAGGIVAELLLDEPCSSQLKLEAGGIEPKLSDACSQLKPELGSKPEMPDASAIQVKIGRSPRSLAATPSSPPSSPDQCVSALLLLFMCQWLPAVRVQAIPMRFHQHLPEACVAAVLLYRRQSWTTSYCSDMKVKLDAVWGASPSTTSCGSGMPASSSSWARKLKVLRGDLPEELTSKCATSDEPLSFFAPAWREDDEHVGNWGQNPTLQYWVGGDLQQIGLWGGISKREHQAKEHETLHQQTYSHNLKS